MADNVAITAGTGTTMAADEVVDGTLGTVKVGFGKIMDGTLDGTNKLAITAGNAAKVDGSATTQPVSAASLPLPSGAATAAKQPALGTAGTASADVITVQGKASMTPLLTDGSATTQPVSLASVPSHAVTNAGTFAVQAAEADGANVTLGAKADAKSTATDTTAVTAMSVLKQISASVQAPPSQAVTNAGTFAVQAASSTATGSAVPANAVYVGANAATALPTAATAGNLTGVMTDKFGRQVVLQGTLRDLVGTQTTTISASTSETTIVTAAASTFNDLSALVVSNTSATAARVDFRDTTAGSILFSIYVPAGDIRGIAFTRVVPQTTVNTNWTAQSSASVTDLRVFAVWDKNK